MRERTGRMGAPQIDRVVVINDDAAGQGGAAAIALASAQLLHQRGVPVKFLSGGDDLDSELRNGGVAAEVIGGRHLLEGPRGAAALRGLYDPATCAELCRWIAAHDTPGTVYHLHNWHKVLSPSVFKALRRVAARLVISAHDYFLACPNGGYFLYPKQRECELRPGGLRCLATACDRRRYAHKLWRAVRHRVRQGLIDLARGDAIVLAVHEGMVPHFARAGIAPPNIRVLRNPVVPWRSERVPAERNRDAFFIGRLEGDKGVDLAARAARRAGVRLQLIGAGPLSDALAREHPEAALHGWRSRHQISELIGEARLLVAPSRGRETFGLAALEALMSGVPVIVSQFALIGKEVAQLRLGHVCNPYDEAALATAISELVQDDRRTREISRRAFAVARQLAPMPDAWCDGLLALYGERLDRARRISAQPRPGRPPISTAASETSRC